MSDTMLLPHIDEVNAPFWEGCQEGVLRLQQCPDTGRLIFPPRPVNPWSPRQTAKWVEVNAGGTIWSVIEPHAPLMMNFSELAPYNAIVVALDVDPTIRMVGNLVAEPNGAINTIAADTIIIGTAVTAVFEKIDEHITLPRWMAVQ